MLPSLTESYFAAVAEASPDVMRILELDGTVEFMSARGLQLLEIDSFDRNHRRLWPELWPAEARPAMREAMEAARQGRVGRFRAFCPTAKGKPRWWDSTVSPVRNDKGEVVRLLATSRDVSAEVRRDERLRDAVTRIRRANAEKAKALNHLRDALEVMPAGVAFYDADDRLVIWNAEYVAAGGADSGSTNLREGMTFIELLERDLEDGRHPDAMGREAEWIAQRLAARANAGGPHEQKLANGRWYRFEDRRLLGGGMVAVAVDITALKTREADLAVRTAELAKAKSAAEAASEAKSAFLANMSHEIRTPLNGVLAMADALCTANLERRERELAEIVRESAHTLEKLLADILDLARVESGAIAVERAPFSLVGTLQNVVAVSGLKAAEKNLQLSLVIQPELDIEVMGDATRVKQIAHNLISNAVKFTDQGAVSVTLAKVGEYFRISVKDTGIGFDLGDRERLFRRFEQADESITRRFGGSGLGLAISHELAALMGGRLDCSSSPGQGAEFWVDLPLVIADQPASERRSGNAASFKRPLRVLVADDHPTNRRVVHLILAGAGVEAVCVNDGREALQALGSEVFDLVLMDIQMPVMDGITAVRELRGFEQKTGRLRTPVVMLSANALPEHVRVSAEAGADGHVSKPITAQRLLAAVQEALDCVGTAAGDQAEERASATTR